MMDIGYKGWIVVLMVTAWGCSSTGGSTIVQNPQNRPDWESMVDSGEVGKADFLNEELEHLDSWPYPLNEQDVYSSVIYSKDPRFVDSCSRFLTKKGKNYRIHAEFVIEPTGKLQYIYILNDAGACRDIALDVLKRLRFAPGIFEGEYVRTYVMYPLDLTLDDGS